MEEGAAACESVGISNANTQRSRPDESDSAVGTLTIPKFSTDEIDAILREYKRVGIVTSDRNHSVRFAFESDRMVLSARNVDLGEAREEVPIELSGAPMVTGFNVKYFQDILSGGEKQRMGRDYDFKKVIQWFAERAAALGLDCCLALAALVGARRALVAHALLSLPRHRARAPGRGRATTR